MEQSKKLKLFICYSHKDNCSDNPYVEQFKEHIAPLKEKYLIEEWYDREILPGDDYQNQIDNNLEEADIICLFISSHFFYSDSCKKEKKKALKLREQKGISVISIILSDCGWLDDEDISKPLVLPTDGKSVSSFQNRDEAWHDVYMGLKTVIEEEIKVKQWKITEEFENFLQDTEILKEAHSQKERVLLEDIFVHPELDKYDILREDEEKIGSDELFKNLLNYPKIVIAGEDQSGKTTLCKMIFKELRNKNFFPVYVNDKENQFKGKIENKILTSLRKQYEGGDIGQIDRERIIPIIDDFHFAKDRERHIKDLSTYHRCIVFVDDIFCLNIKDEKLVGQFSHFKIREFMPSLIYELIKKWVSLTDKERDIYKDIDYYKDIDQKTEIIKSVLGRNIDRGIMPAYPFFILSTIFTYETFSMPLEQEITSQGYCYQAFIFFYLRKEGVRIEDIDTYINFLTEFASYIYREKKSEISSYDFTSFMELYLEKYNLPIKQEILIKNLSTIVSVDSFNNYSFQYPYIYYFFVAKYLVENIEDEEVKDEIKNIIGNLNVAKNAYIAVFMAHHSRNIKILEEIEKSTELLFNEYKPATLIKDEVKFFDEQADNIVKAILPSADTTPESERMKRLNLEDKQEQYQKNIEQKEKFDEEDFVEIEFLETELRRAIKTVEVMGCIIKNRAGSLEKKKLEKIFVESMNAHLRILSFFFEMIKSEDISNAVIDIISERLIKINKESRSELSDEYLRKKAKIIFWNLIFDIGYAIIDKIVHSLGSDKLTAIVEKVCYEVNTPASFLVKHGILMWYNKSPQIDEISKRIRGNDFSEMAKGIIKSIIVNHCYLHPISYRDKQRIESKLGIPSRKLLKSG